VRHRKSSAKLGKTGSHRRAMLRNMVTSLLRHERIKTTLPKAKEARRYAEKMITLGKKETLAARRRAYRFISDTVIVKKIFDNLAYRYVERKGGYTRIIKIGPRRGDAAEMVFLELVDRPEPTEEDLKGDKKKKASESTKNKVTKTESKEESKKDTKKKQPKAEPAKA